MKSNSRYLGALLIAPFIIFIFLGGIYLKGFTIAISVLGMYEFYKSVKTKDFRPIEAMGYLMLIAYYITNNDFKLLSYIIIIATFLTLCAPVLDVKYTFIDVSLTLLGFMYVGIFFSFIHLVNVKDGGQYLVWLIFIGSWLCDTTAYYAGRLFGKHKLCPKVSPKKTIEGSLGGMLGSTVFCGIFGIIIFKYFNVIPIYHYFIIGAFCGVFSQFGDLVASSIKRFVGIKDYSNLIPGHGGILDRFDSILFSGAVVYFYLTLIVCI
ncbi:phosphatidate cytidylyltransferase [Clostridium cavendishii DSM 21758]|uniref:Phosphatidate cytidylyltransferase n=1 Tax=Clostridium cavendishii DSM 21758 TaxID=1121302 RepID=A0A1M6RL37_9CLOT|nr:phosphatidate cytidylyltransferase [Clostridium cavendishii]SHK33136.1 phosphatidate cytidylyltransferase [Clostridium cavendishii DSM 21758]